MKPPLIRPFCAWKPTIHKEPARSKQNRKYPLREGVQKKIKKVEFSTRRGSNSTFFFYYYVLNGRKHPEMQRIKPERLKVPYTMKGLKGF